MTHLPIFLVCFCCLVPCVKAQEYKPANVFAHNDYVRTNPFYTAYGLGVGYIEADVFLHNGDLMVAHHKHEIVAGRTLANLYLQPLLKAIRKNNGLAYKNPEQSLTLMIDLKTEGGATLNAVVDLLKKCPELISCRTLQILISGNVPDPKKWSGYPPYIYFDGRPSISYDQEQLKRIGLISANFGAHSSWKGRGQLTQEDRMKISSLVDDAHRKGKKFRFWATPDFPGAWKELMALNMDVIVTDDVMGLVQFLNDQEN